MKRLLALALVAMMAGGAMAQPSIGIFFSTSTTMPAGFDPFGFEGAIHPNTVTPSGTFYTHVVVAGLTGFAILNGYEFGILVPAEDDDFFPMGGWDYMGIGAGIDATYPGIPGSYCRAHGYTVPRAISADYMIVMQARFRSFYGTGFGQWSMGPWGLTTTMPKIVVDSELELNVPVLVEDYQGGWAVCAGEGVVATESMTWSNVKSLFN